MMKVNRRRDGERGFTLLELLAVMGIMMLMAGIAVMSYFGATRGAAARSAVSHLQNNLSFARQTAIMNRRSAYLIFEAKSNVYAYVVCLQNGTGTGSGTALSPAEYSDWSGLVENAEVYNLEDGVGSIIDDVTGSSFTTSNSIWNGQDKYGWPIQKKMYLPRNFVVAEVGLDTLPEAVVFRPDGTVRVSGYEFEVFESLPGVSDPVKVRVTVEGLTGFTSVEWPDG